MEDTGGPSYRSIPQVELPLTDGHVQRPDIYYNEGEFDPPSSDDEDGVEVYNKKTLAGEEDGLLTVGTDAGSRRYIKSPLRALVISLLSLVGLAAFIGFFAAKSYKGGNAWHDGKEWGVTRIGNQKLTMDHVFNGTFSARRESLRWVPEAGDGVYTTEEHGLIKLVDLSKGTNRTLVNKQQVVDDLHEQLTWNSWSLSSDMRYILIRSNSEKLWRWSSHSDYYIHDLTLNFTRAIAPPRSPPAIAHAELTKTDPPTIIFVQDNDIYVLPLPAIHEPPIRITNSGSETVFNGITDWVYEEEVYSGIKALWPSNDPKDGYVAYLAFDETKVRNYTFPVYNPGWTSAEFGAYTNFTTMKYPKPGYSNPIATLNIFCTNAPYTKPTTLSWPSTLSSSERVITQVVWIDTTSLIIKEMNRAATKGSVVHFDLSTGLTSSSTQGRVARRLGKDGEEGDDGWIQQEQRIMPLKKGGYLDVVPNKDGWNHIAHFDAADSGEPHWLTSGEWEVSDGIAAVDEDAGLVYFTAAKPSIERHIFSAPLRPKTRAPIPTEIKSLTDTSTRGWYDARFSSKSGYYVLSYDGPNVPVQKVLSTKNSSWEIVLQDNARLNDTIESFIMPSILWGTMMSDGYELNTVEIRPPNFDSSGRTKYPVFFQVYGGPNSQTVNTRYGIDWHTYLAASLKYIVVRVDGRGTGLKGRKHRNGIKGQLGKLEVTDQINAAKEWAGKPYVDRCRVGIWGWSYGGYMTAKIAEADKGYHRLAISVAPVADWRLYDSIYTERYMGVPSETEMDGAADEEGKYYISGVHNVTGFDHLDYALAHGSGDDNVHYANTAHLLDMFTTNRIRKYRFRMFTDSDHSISTRGAYRELHEWLTAFLMEKWGHGALQKQYPV